MCLSFSTSRRGPSVVPSGISRVSRKLLRLPVLWVTGGEPAGPRCWTTPWLGSVNLRTSRFHPNAPRFYIAAPCPGKSKHRDRYVKHRFYSGAGDEVVALCWLRLARRAAWWSFDWSASQASNLWTGKAGRVMTNFFLVTLLAFITSPNQWLARPFDGFWGRFTV